MTGVFRPKWSRHRRNAEPGLVPGVPILVRDGSAARKRVEKSFDGIPPHSPDRGLLHARLFLSMKS